MNIKEAADNWGVAVRTVQGWCKDGWVASAEKDVEKGTWTIDSEALRPLKFSDKRQEKYINRLALILAALSEQKTIPPAKLHCDQSELLEHFEELCDLQFVQRRKIKGDNKSDDIFRCYRITLQGAEFLEDRQGIKKIAADLQALVAGVSEGITKALINQNSL